MQLLQIHVPIYLHQCHLFRRQFNRIKLTQSSVTPELIVVWGYIRNFYPFMSQAFTKFFVGFRILSCIIAAKSSVLTIIKLFNISYRIIPSISVLQKCKQNIYHNNAMREAFK